ncbi:elongation factor G [Candidatus Aerophobetes bacterium]|uniref:Elongation factor G n=1 Tax=Aerophobetes bacterium TaxID=2030807 RepID=A0A662D5J0_UNCAE|nr:MAG: elongation factor G [Candidatus Aerophobetes bacterium]
MSISIENLRNVAIVGQQGVGKTSLAEAMLYQAGVIDKMGSVKEKTTVSDYDKLERERGFSINPSLLYLMWQDHKINLLDTPGFVDFIEKVKPVLRATESALVVISPSTVAGTETKKVWEYASQEKIPRLIWLNKLDEEMVNFSRLITEIEEEFAISCPPLQLPLIQKGVFSGVIDLIKLKMRTYKNGESEEKPIPEEFQEEVGKFRKKLLEAVAETEDGLIEKYLEEEDLSEEDIKRGLKNGFVKGAFAPLICGSAIKGVGIDILLDTIVNFLPSPLVRESTKEKSLSAFVFQTLSEAHLGEISLFKVYSGVLSSGSAVYNSVKGKEEKIGQIYLMRGNKREEISQVVAGDVGALAKLKDTDTGDVFCTKENPVTFPPLEFSEPTTSIALKPEAEKDEQKMSTALAKLVKVDPLLKVEVDRESGQTILSGMGEVHLEITIKKLKEEFNVRVKTEEPRIPYRETITIPAEAQGKYKRQSGGRGQYGDVWLRIRPLPRGEGFKFVDEIKGGAVPSRYIPAVEKGVKEAMKKGFLASYPLVDMEVTLFDGTYHPVDSSDIAFQIAASMGIRKAVEQAKPILLEPIAEIEVEVPDEFLGEANGDLNSRRARILAVESLKNRKRIKAHIPVAELHNYSTHLRSLTQGKGTFRKKFSHYERVPDEIAQRIIAQSKKSEKS